MMMIMGTMLEKYLRKEHGFWRVKTSDGRRWYCKHTTELGGIFAYIEQDTPGMTIVAGNVTMHLDHVAEVSDFLARVERAAARDYHHLVQALQRSRLARTLRTMTL